MIMSSMAKASSDTEIKKIFSEEFKKTIYKK